MPGVYFLVGLYVVVRPVPLFRAAFSPSATLPSGLSFLLSVIVIAFIVGQFLQIGGSAYDGDHGFDDFMWAVRGRSVETRYDVSDVERHFWEMCRSRFELTGEFDSHDRLFKFLMSFLEQRDRARALRMQALYLFVRGVFVATVILLVIAGVLLAAVVSDLVSPQVTEVVRSWEALVTYLAILCVLAFVTDRNRRGNEKGNG